MRRLQRGDLIAYYSPRERLDEGSPAVRAFTAIGRIQDDDPFEVKQGEDFHPFRRKADFLEADRAPIAELLDKLSFTRGKRSGAWRSGGVCLYKVNEPNPTSGSDYITYYEYD